MKSVRMFIPLAVLLTVANLAAHGSESRDATADYDEHLCRFAQRFLINADTRVLPVVEQTGYGNGFHVIQMDVDARQRRAQIAMTTDFATFDGAQLATHVSCKMVDRERVNDVLNMQLPPPDRQCREVNERTYRLAMNSLTDAERSHYLAAGRPLTFADDAILATGGEWLPAVMDRFIRPSESGVEVRSPSVRVPWNRTQRNFYQGTQHCKLLTLAVVQRWMRVGAFDPKAPLVPAGATRCDRPHSTTSRVGSCRFYFAPAGAMFCQDYSGADWTGDTARQECAERHADAESLRAARNKYTGTGGIFDADSCRDRKDAPPISGTCVFHCNQADETLWHVAGVIDPQMTRGCDLFLPPGD